LTPKQKIVQLWGLAVLASLSACNSDKPSVDSADISAITIMASSCSGCHHKGNTAIPDISALSSDALYTSMSANLVDTDAPMSPMHRIAKGYSEEDIRAISDYLGAKND